MKLADFSGFNEAAMSLWRSATGDQLCWLPAGASQPNGLLLLRLAAVVSMTAVDDALIYTKRAILAKQGW
nr:hypothetical protein [Brasilonema sp. UFV-L1]